jgi:hypothetical protein
VGPHHVRLFEGIHAHSRCHRGPAGDSAVLDGEAVILRPDNSFDFEAPRSRQGPAEAILVAYDVMEVDGQNVGKTSEAALAVATRECATPSERRKRLP